MFKKLRFKLKSKKSAIANEVATMGKGKSGRKKK